MILDLRLPLAKYLIISPIFFIYNENAESIFMQSSVFYTCSDDCV